MTHKVMSDEEMQEEVFLDFLGEITSGLEDTTLAPSQVIAHMYLHDETPDEVSLWEPLEYSSPRELTKEWVRQEYIKYDSGLWHDCEMRDAFMIVNNLTPKEEN